MELSIVILNWNAAADTIRCVCHIASWERLRPTIWVVDNASIDGSVEIIADECPTVHLIRNPANLGFAGGTNRGIIEALGAGDGPILLLNNDAFIAEEDAISLINILRANKHIGLVGPLLFDAEQPDQLLSAGGKNPVLHHQTRILAFNADEPLRPVEHISGTAVLVRAEVFRAIGLLDEDYFFSTELADLCRRAKGQGYLSVIATQAQAYHTLSRSANFRDTLHVYYIIRNRFLYMRKFYRQPAKAFLYGIWGLYSLVLAGKLYLSGQHPTARAVCLGLIDGWQGRFRGQNERVLTTCRRDRTKTAEVLENSSV
jgi:GT2 family glycosyltransferase